MSQLEAVIFGAIGTISETSDLQRQAFNAAFASVGLDWNWSSETYHDLLKVNGGQNRLKAYRDKDPVRSDISDQTIVAVHTAKIKHYLTILEHTPLCPRTGVVELLAACKQDDIRVAFCTSTSVEHVNGIRTALSGLLAFDQFEIIVTKEQIDRPKPAPDAYLYCLEQMGITADQAIAIEDTPVSITAAKAAGLTTIATPGATTLDQDFAAADLIVPDLSEITIDRLSGILAGSMAITAQ